MDVETSSSATASAEKTEEDDLQRVLEEQRLIPRPSNAEECRTLMHLARYGVLSTISKKVDGYPSGSVVGFATDENGVPFFAFSSMSSHTQNIESDKRASLTVTHPEYRGAQDARLNIIGDINKVPEADAATLREQYRAKHPEAFWLDFGDFSIYKFSEIHDVSLISGFARAATVSPNQYQSAKPDPLAEFGKPVMNHMNKDHTEDLKAYVKRYLGLGDVDDARMKSIDRLGFDMDVKVRGEECTLRIKFPEEVTTRKAIKDAFVQLSVQLTQEAAPASS